MIDQPRSEYPRPQFVRKDWLCLNGFWQFEIDHGDSGLERGLRENDLADTINVPFCPESKLSGIEHVDYMRAVWYRREVEVPATWKNKRVLLHFGAVDYDTTVWCNDIEVRRHRGGSCGFSCDLGEVAGQAVTIVVRARDYPEQPKPSGKQSVKYANAGCHYTRTTGIWQTVWIEPVPTPGLGRPRITPDVGNGCFHLEQPIVKPRGNQRYRATLSSAGEQVATADCVVSDFAPRLTLSIPEDKRRLWSIDDPHLYDLELELLDTEGNVLDSATSYAGLRSVTIDGKAIKLNGTTVFQRLVLDQGYYADGLLTAPNDAAHKHDIELSIAAGFNGARLHQNVFEERFLYHADRLGYLCWGEFSDWSKVSGEEPNRPAHGPTFITQWLECVERDYNHPCIVGWCPINEQAQPMHDVITDLDDVIRGMFDATKAYDLTRPVLDASGSVPYDGQPYFVSEFGGIWWNPQAAEDEPSWGYGARPETEEEFLARFEGLCKVLLDDPNMFGYCYTRLTDVFQGQNGIYRFDRRAKVDDAGMQRIHADQTRPAAIELQVAPDASR